ncbi:MULTISPECIES: hypothetical protein [Methylomonas]|uniref:hypothetical protein n=1 Tax=Methylomonas TaxID=416 RepID=UPI001E606D94|nr:hypothetical protein [Methylomonas rhizoryzae]
MTHTPVFLCTSSMLIATAAFSVASFAADIQIGFSGKTFASSVVQCAADPNGSGEQVPSVQAGLFNAKPGTSAGVFVNGSRLAVVTTANPSTGVALADGNNSVVVRISKKTADRYAFTVQPGMCLLPDTSGNTFSNDGSLEYAASGKSYATVTPGCALNPATGLSQPYVNVFDNGTYLLNVSINGTPLTQLNGTTRPKTPVFLSAGTNVISLANAYISTDYFIRDGGSGNCTLP